MTAATASALRLKEVCTHLITRYTPNAPGEGFLFRGNAYMALDQPFFALPDYLTAAKMISVSPFHQQQCCEQLDKLPARVIGTFRGTNRYQEHLIEPKLESDLVKVDCSPKMGGNRGLFALKDIPEGDIVLKAKAPWMQYPLTDGVCAHCCRPITRSFICKNPNCHEEYCSRECRTEANGVYHATVCQNKSFQGMELETYSQYTNCQDAVEKRALALELLILRVRAHIQSMNVVPSILRELQTLSGRLVFSPKRLASNHLDRYFQLGEATETLNAVNFEEYTGLMARLSSNFLFSKNKEKIFVYIPYAMVNHSCQPNAAFDYGTEEKDEGGKNSVMTTTKLEVREIGNLVTTKKIKAGEEIFRDYFGVSSLSNFEDRQKKLLHEHQFVCMAPCCASQRR